MAPVNLLRVSEQNRWPTGRPVTAPSTQTATRFLDILKPGFLEQMLVEVTHDLIRGNLLAEARLAGYILIAIDGTKQENHRRWFAPWRRKYRYVLHAKVIGPNGTAFTVFVESCDSYDTESRKLDCERAAFQRLALRLKAEFPRQAICLLGDALFACDAVYDTCRRLRAGARVPRNGPGSSELPPAHATRTHDRSTSLQGLDPPRVCGLSQAH